MDQLVDGGWSLKLLENKCANNWIVVGNVPPATDSTVSLFDILHQLGSVGSAY